MTEYTLPQNGDYTNKTAKFDRKDVVYVEPNSPYLSGENVKKVPRRIMFSAIALCDSAKRVLSSPLALEREFSPNRVDAISEHIDKDLYDLRKSDEFNKLVYQLEDLSVKLYARASEHMHFGFLPGFTTLRYWDACDVLTENRNQLLKQSITVTAHPKSI